MKESVVFSVPGKIIISGEHAVVYGYSALVAAVDRRIKLTVSWKKNGWDFRFGAGKSGISELSGMGLSAVYAVLEAAALSWIVSKKLNKEKISRIAHEIENLAHGTASGVDTTVVTFGGILKYEKQERFNKFNKFNKMPKLLVVNTGKSAETTGEMVMKVKSSKLKVKSVLRKIGELPEKFVKVLNLSDLNKLSNLIKENQRLLEKLGVVGEKAKKIVKEIGEIGGAAKICGAGGVKKGSGIALAYHKDLDVIRRFCKKNNLECFEVELGGEGLKMENDSMVQ